MKVLAVVPARGGSKRCPGKNIAGLGDVPLINWTLKAAKDSGVCDEVIVTTDSPSVAAVANAYWGSDIVHHRHASLARDDTPMLPVILDVFDHHPADIVITLQPTSPFREPSDIRYGLDMLMSTKADSVFSVTEAPEDLVFEVGHAQRLRRLPDVVVPNGALFLITGDALRRGESWFSGLAYGYKMPKDKSLDIDTDLDLEIARMIVAKRLAA